MLGLALAASTLAQSAAASCVATATASSTAAPSGSEAAHRATLDAGCFVVRAVPAGARITMFRGLCFTLALPGALDWTTTSSGAAIRVLPVRSSARRRWQIRAVRAGNATIRSLGRPRCAAGTACPQCVVLREFRVHVAAPPAGVG